MTSADEQQIAASTIGHYDTRARAYWEGTRDHDVSQNIQALLNAIETPSSLTILDLGCGPGRDLIAFKELGHNVIGLDGSAQFVEMAAANSGCEVWQQDLMQLSLPQAHFDGVFANAALFHVPTRALPQVLGELKRSLKPGGVLFSSNPLGNDQAGWNAARYGVYHSLAGWRRFVTAAGFVEVTHYYRPPEAPQWLASVWRKPASV